MLQSPPSTYQPSSLRGGYAAPPAVDRVWSVGQESEPGNVALEHGPFSNLEQALEVVGENAFSVIVQHEPEGSQSVVYRWDVGLQSWTIV